MRFKKIDNIILMINKLIVLKNKFKLMYYYIKYFLVNNAFLFLIVNSF
jgi:hypothetical protein